ncbi:hypothetical protein BT67DRAFT_441817 [Trichocladium antarcticum]|uniref:Uncharacterized protein n=1 Tax=Trichocladium antarcticum TaxID=1450529 RepID=A0AAN6UKE6_9PEZI|nr:hypothetical protein BT67DRAFT_441817 [Trichocladium antarcticum]
MRLSHKTLATCAAVAAPALAQITDSLSLESVSGCAAVVSTTDICSTCMAVACVVPATVTAGCGGCAETAPTIFRSHGCDRGCDGLGGCKTVYTVVTSSGDVCSVSTAGTGSALSGTVSAVTTVSTGVANRLVPPLRLW